MGDRVTEVAGKADFGLIRYAQVWEDADVLTRAVGDVAGEHLLSIASAGDNALALLVLDPARVTALDISPAQIECVNLRVGAYRALEHREFLELMGARPSHRRADLLERATARLPDRTRTFWRTHADAVRRHGAGGIGRFERYFRHFRRFVLSLTHSRHTIDQVFVSRDSAARRAFFHTRFENWRWRLLTRLFFSRFAMARLGRDPAFFDYVGSSVADHVARRVRHAGIDCDPADNPYLHWILKGGHGLALPMAWRPEHYEAIRDRLDRLDIREQSLEAYLDGAERIGGFNLSDIFEYMGEDVAARLYARLLDAADPGARLVYWNMMVPRRVPPALASRVRTLTDLEDELKAVDRAFFYSDLVIEEVRA